MYKDNLLKENSYSAEKSKKNYLVICLLLAAFFYTAYSTYMNQPKRVEDMTYMEKLRSGKLFKYNDKFRV